MELGLGTCYEITYYDDIVGIVAAEYFVSPTRNFDEMSITVELSTLSRADAGGLYISTSYVSEFLVRI